ncbi:unnamed protein product [Cylindrotheca closterium]|uniref:Uncharacterized protein n=1 Tax=Cylindrotheca closterium TaxID=2856 RepID=A0AAD2CG10_9STRA|nr:unnamed protein product [Cylindrotheca closterium]
MTNYITTFINQESLKSISFPKLPRMSAITQQQQQQQPVQETIITGLVQSQSCYFGTWYSTLTEPIRDFAGNGTDDSLLFPSFVVQKGLARKTEVGLVCSPENQTVSVSPKSFVEPLSQTSKSYNLAGNAGV